MLSQYYEQLKQLYDLLRNGRGMDFGLWKEAMALTFLIIIQTLGFLIVLALMFAVPVIVKKKNDSVFQPENAQSGKYGDRE